MSPRSYTLLKRAIRRSTGAERNAYVESLKQAILRKKRARNAKLRHAKRQAKP